VLAYVSPHAPDIGALLTRHGVPAFADAESCTAALDGMLRVGRFHAQGDAAPAADVAIGALPRGSLDEAQAKQLFGRFGVRCAAERIVHTPAQAQAAAQALGGRVVLKILSSQITHKSDVGGVAVGLTPQTIADRLVQMAADVEARSGVRPDGFLVQEMVDGGTEVILGMHRDALGTAVMLGMGGVTAELFKDTTMRLLPSDGGLSRADALSMAKELKTWPLLDGFRGRPKADLDGAIDAVLKIAGFALANSDTVAELDVNPLIVCAEGKGAWVADALIVKEEP
jgi:acyl-CoA synthetase (NDP forming)